MPEKPSSITSRIEILKREFKISSSSKEGIYLKIMDFGRQLSPFDPNWKMDDNLVRGCQSQMFLHTSVKEGILEFSADSDALISKGLAALLLFVYSGENGETILRTSPSFLEEIGIVGSLTPGRANGLASLYLRIKEAALNSLLATS